MINVKKLIEMINKKTTFKTQEGRIIRKSFQERKKEKKEQLGRQIVDDIQKNRNHTWIEEIYNRKQDINGNIIEE